MDVKPWQVLVGASAFLALYGVGVVFLNVPVSIVSFLTMVVFVSLGVVLGRLLSRRFS